LDLELLDHNLRDWRVSRSSEIFQLEKYLRTERRL